MVTPTKYQYCTYHQLNIGHGMVQTGPDDTHQLMADIHDLQTHPLVVVFVPFLGATTHLCCIVGSKGKALEMTVCRNSPHLNKVLKGKTIEGSFQTTGTLCSLVHVFSARICPARIVTSGTSVLAVVGSFELLEALCLGIVDILGKGDENRRRRGSIGSRHFVWRTG